MLCKFTYQQTYVAIELLHNTIQLEEPIEGKLFHGQNQSSPKQICIRALDSLLTRCSNYLHSRLRNIKIHIPSVHIPNLKRLRLQLSKARFRRVAATESQQQDLAGLIIIILQLLVILLKRFIVLLKSLRELFETARVLAQDLSANLDHKSDFLIRVPGIDSDISLLTFLLPDGIAVIDEDRVFELPSTSG